MDFFFRNLEQVLAELGDDRMLQRYQFVGSEAIFIKIPEWDGVVRLPERGDAVKHLATQAGQRRSRRRQRPRATTAKGGIA